MRDSKLKRKLVVAYEVVYAWWNRVALRKLFCLKIMSAEQTIRYIRKTGCSVARYGDGEFGHMMGKGNTEFQPSMQELSNKLIETLCKKDERVLLCVPACINTYRGMTRDAKSYWQSWEKHGQKQAVITLLRDCVGKKYCFGDSLFTRPYMDWKDRRRAKRIFQQIKLLWRNREILVVEGSQTRLGVGNDLLDGAKSVKRILAPATGAFGRYNQIRDAVERHYQGELILLALGPAATVLAAELAGAGHQALDIGHIDIEYEWFLQGSDTKIAISGKYVHEVATGKNPRECKDKKYLSQIVEIIGN